MFGIMLSVEDQKHVTCLFVSALYLHYEAVDLWNYCFLFRTVCASCYLFQFMVIIKLQRGDIINLIKVAIQLFLYSKLAFIGLKVHYRVRVDLHFFK